VAPRSALRPTIRGRAEELAALGEQLARVRSGSGAVVLIVIRGRSSSPTTAAPSFTRERCVCGVRERGRPANHWRHEHRSRDSVVKRSV
jgi:hypothetical protein